MTRRTAGILLLCAGPWLVWAQTTPPLAAPPLALTNVTVIDGTGAAAQINKTVIITANRIDAVIDANNALPKGAQVVAARGKFLIPGLWDMHVHLKQSDLPLLVAHGVTGVRDMGNILESVEAWRTRIAARTMVGPQIFRVGPILNGKQFGPVQVAIESAAEARAAVRVLKHVGVDAIKMHRALPRDAYLALADEAKRLSIPFVGHIPQSVTALEASESGQASIEHVETLYEGQAPLKFEEAPALFQQFARNDTAYDPILSAYHRSTDPANVDPKLLQKYPDLISGRQKLFGRFVELVGLMNRAGVTLMTGTDLGVPGIPPGTSLHDEIELLVNAGLTPMQALEAATRTRASIPSF